jgi:hypothetical protein
MFARPALFASAGFGERVSALQFGQFLFQVHGRDYNEQWAEEPREFAIPGSPSKVTEVLATKIPTWAKRYPPAGHDLGGGVLLPTNPLSLYQPDAFCHL